MELYTETEHSKGYIGSVSEIMSLAISLGKTEQTHVREWKWWLGKLVEYDRPSIIRVVNNGNCVANVMLNCSGEPFYIIVDKNTPGWCVCDLHHPAHTATCAACGLPIYWISM